MALRKSVHSALMLTIATAPAHTAYVLGKPLLLLLTAKCPLGIPAIQLSNTKPYAPHLTSRELQTGHWLHLEAHDVVNAELRQFLEN